MVLGIDPKSLIHTGQLLYLPALLYSISFHFFEKDIYDLKLHMQSGLDLSVCHPSSRLTGTETPSLDFFFFNGFWELNSGPHLLAKLCL